MSFKEKQFNIPKLKGLSEETIEDHLKLYAGYVKHSNLILEKIDELAKDAKSNAYALGELQRRFGFEYDGMRNHEVYFESLSDGSKEVSKDSELYKSIDYIWGSYDAWLNRFKSIALTRGIGWAILYFDKEEQVLLNAFVEDHQLGQLTGCVPILALDMWEHAFVRDYRPSGKSDYVEDFFHNLNWKYCEKRLDNTAK